MDNNHVRLNGVISKKAVVKATKTGGTFVAFWLSTSKQTKSGTFWVRHNIVSFSQRIAGMVEHLPEQTQLIIDGQLEYNTWENKQGVKQTTAQVVAYECEVVGLRDTQPGNEPAW